MIQLSDAGKRYGHKLLFEHADWMLTPEDRIGLVGANGTGKSTLMKILAGIETLDYGSIARTRGISAGYLPQDGLTLSGRTVFAECLSVFEELRQIVQSRIEIALNPLPHLVSIIVPALDEQATVARVLRDLVQVDLSPLGISKEIILVDGGSADRTVELAQGIRGVKVLASAHRIGRGEALRRGIQQARGGQILFYPSDAEYNPEDIPGILTQLLSGRFEAVFGTRNLVIRDLKSHLKSVYGESAGLSLLSRYGGMLISILTLLLYNRYITDTLTGLKAFDATVLRKLELKSSGVDLEMEIVAKLSRQQRFILEVPIQFKARTRAQGKKMNVADGLRALLALFRFRITS